MRALLLHELLVQSAQRAPGAPALVDGTREFSYSELDAWSNAIARVLVEQGVEAGDRVAIHMDKAAEAVAAIFGALKAGAVYVPFDPDSPDGRLAYVAINATVRVVCTSVAKLASVTDMIALGAPFQIALVLDATVETLSNLPDLRVLTADDVRGVSSDPVAVRRIPEDLAYILYTSGSTGHPKGVMISHRAALGFVSWAVEAIGVTGTDRLSNHAPFHFDLSIFDIFASSMAGATVVLVPPMTSRFPVEVRRFIERQRISVWYSVPSVLSMLALRGGLSEGGLPGLRAVLFAGEVFPNSYLRRLVQLIPHATYWNLYGPTETNVCTGYRVGALDPDGDTPLPIGRAIDGDETFVVTDDGRLAELGEAGVLYVRGVTLMSGYWADPERTARVLAPSRFHAPLPDLAYCTEDLVRERADGHYDFLGRRDLQVKRRGYRIELGEIEAALLAVECVLESAVVALPDDLFGNRIHAYAAICGNTSRRELVEACKTRLPKYMVPDRIDVLAALPKTSTGKIDRRALYEFAAEWSTHGMTDGHRS